MANRVKIEIVSNPPDWSNLIVQIISPTTGGTIYNKRFLPLGYVATIPDYHVVKAASDVNTLLTLSISLQDYNIDPNLSFELAYPFIYVNFAFPEIHTFTVLNDASGSFVVTLEDIVIPEPETIEPLDIKDISIEVIDTYTNERILIEETAQANACILKYNGGDDLYKNLVASTLDFNLWVENGEDAHFIHLFTGDEKRYKVKVNAINAAEEVQLIWQGFLLPDEYKEPYQNGNLFVDFTATDMLGTLKGKYFEPWYYQNTFPIGQLLAYCLAETGLEQNILVKPCVVPASNFYDFDKITIPLKAFLDDDKRKDVYEILTGVLESNGLCLSSYRGYWILEGISRKGEIDAEAIQFDVDGNRVENLLMEKVVKTAYFQVTPTVSSVSPWRQVDIEFEAKGTKNLFSDEVVRIEQNKLFYSYYKALGYNLPTDYIPLDLFCVKKIQKWTENINPQFKSFDFYNSFETTANINWYSYFTWNYIPVGANSDYNYTEALALNNWFECKENPYVKPGNLYEFEISFSVWLSVGLNTDTFEKNLKNGMYDRLCPFQIFLNNVEKFSNRPSFSSDVNVRYEVGFTASLDREIATFKLKFNFNVDVDGYLRVRYLVPIHQQGSGNNDFKPLRVIAETLKLTLIEDYEENSSLIAYRDINFTTKQDYKIELSSTVDNSVLNSMGLNAPLNQNYIKNISRSNDNVDIETHHYFVPNTDLSLFYETFIVSIELIRYLFEKNNLRSVFLSKSSGDYSFSDLWFGIRNNIPRLAFLKSFEGFPVIPKKYKAYPDVAPEDVLKYMHVEYSSENYSERLNWKVFGTSTVLSFPKALAKVIHGVQPEALFTVEGTVYEIVFLNDIMQFYFKDENRNFIPTQVTIDLFEGKTKTFLFEDKFEVLNDISYE